jgi:hypothetical protein
LSFLSFTGTSTLIADSLTIDSGALLNILDWSSGDIFDVGSFTGSPSDIYFNGIQGGVFSGSQLTPVPEPPFCAALMALGLFAGMLWSRARRAHQAS